MTCFNLTYNKIKITKLGFRILIFRNIKVFLDLNFHLTKYKKNESKYPSKI